MNPLSAAKMPRAFPQSLAEQQESHHIEAKILNSGDKQSPPSEYTLSTDDVTTIATGNDGESLRTHVEETMDLRAIIKNAYRKDTICEKIIVQPGAYQRFGIQEGLIWTKNQLKRDVICILRDISEREEADQNNPHQTIGHYCQWKTLNYI